MGKPKGAIRDMLTKNLISDKSKPMDEPVRKLYAAPIMISKQSSINISRIDPFGHPTNVTAANAVFVGDRQRKRRKPNDEEN
jgi:hypothetical protein